MYDYDTAKIETITGIPPKLRQRYISWYSKIPEAVRIGIHALQSDLMRQNRKRFAIPTEMFAYAMMLIAIQRAKGVEDVRRRRGLSVAEAGKITKIRVHRIKAARRGQRPAPLREQILLRCGERIKTLHEEGLSFREIATYLKIYNQIKVSHTYVRTIYINMMAGAEIAV